MSRRRSKTDPFEDLTWDDLEDWAGSSVVSRGRSYQRSHHVQDLARTPGGGLIAWVLGTEKYATRVDFGEGGLTSACTCPYWTTCKHAVAVVLEYLESAKRKTEIPIVTERDPRLADLRDVDEVGAEEWDEYDEGDAED
ncbi:MAG TPA: SWIM zinc finger family protein, partial [Anaerolineae bacterium]|nr:SWIM zinc finger family protein [Anaerolineae bacterium]